MCVIIVDGQNPAPPRMMIIPLFIVFKPSQVPKSPLTSCHISFVILSPGSRAICTWGSKIVGGSWRMGQGGPDDFKEKRLADKVLDLC